LAEKNQNAKIGRLNLDVILWGRKIRSSILWNTKQFWYFIWNKATHANLLHLQYHAYKNSTIYLLLA